MTHFSKVLITVFHNRFNNTMGMATPWVKKDSSKYNQLMKAKL